METSNLSQWEGHTVFDSSGEKVGTIDEVYADRDTGKPEWALVSTGLFGLRKSFLPMAELRPEGGEVHVPYTKQQIHDAPKVSSEEEISQEDEERLFQHYGLSYTSAGSVTSTGGAETGAPGAEYESTERATDYETTGRAETTGGVERHEEELRVGKVRRPSELVRLRKTVETEPVSTDVEVEREEARVVREPVSGTERATGQAFKDDVQEVQLEREEPVVDKDVVARERVRLEKDVQREQQPVEDEVRKERVDVERGDERL
jgi:stress response protein YsnF